MKKTDHILTIPEFRNIDTLISELQRAKYFGANIVSVNCDHDGDNCEVDCYKQSDMTPEEEARHLEAQERFRNQKLRYRIRNVD